MARRPKRSLVEELTQHAAIAAATRDQAAALAVLQPEIAEFVVARRMLDDGLADLLSRRNEAAAAVQAPAQQALPTT